MEKETEFNNVENQFSENIKKESLRPIFYKDDVLGEFKLNRHSNTFEKEVNWLNTTVFMSFDYDEGEEDIEDYIKTAHELYKNQHEWNEKIYNFAADQLLSLANDWYQEGREEYYEQFDPDFEEEDEFFKENEITRNRFMKLMSIKDINIECNGEFSIYCGDGEMFLGHSIVVYGNIDNGLDEAIMAG